MTTVSLDQEDQPVSPTITVGEAATLLGVSEWLVLKQIQQGQLPHRRFGRRILISRARLLAWIDDTPQPPNN